MFRLKIAAVLTLCAGLSGQEGEGVAGREKLPPGAWRLFNPTGRTYSAELLRLKTTVPADFAPGEYAVLEDGREVAHQVERGDAETFIWVLADLKEKEERVYSLERRKPRPFESRVKLERTPDVWTLENEHLALRVPAAMGEQVRPPVEQLRLTNGAWVGRGLWSGERKLKRFTPEVLGEGPLFVKVRLKYEFEGVAGINETPAFFQAEITLPAAQRHAILSEAFENPRSTHWELDVAAGWTPQRAIVKPHFGGFGRVNLPDPDGRPYPWPPQFLKVGQTRMGDTLLNLIPRWSQAYDDGWFFAAHDGTHAVGAAPIRAGRWLWPHDSMIEVKVKPSGDYAGLRCPVWRGKRCWLLLVGPLQTWAAEPACGDYVIRHSVESLDKLHQDYLMEWPGGDPAVNPANCHGRRSKPFFGWGPGAGSLGGPEHPWRTLLNTQVNYDPDTFGSYWLFFSPENPNFATHWWQGVYWGSAKLKDHPRFKDLAKLTEMRLREDLYHSITIPGGAGQECPGYMAGCVNTFHRMAVHCKEYLNFDPSQWPQYRAGPSFLLRLSQPRGDGSRMSHPGGDTHPPGPDVFAMAKTYGIEEDLSTCKTEELPGFGVVFRNKPATPLETYLAFKSGPNRGHYHGDQLAFHYNPYARPQVVDHHCSYNPRAGQEHMHNRVAFHTDEFPYANMDGYERLIAFKTSPEADLAVGQVESERLRKKEKFPPEAWDQSLPELVFDKLLKYRRTIVLVKGGERDYFVIRDQSAGPELYATYCLHVYGEKCEQKGQVFDFDALQVFAAAPEKYQVSRHDWEHQNGGREATKGLRLTVPKSRSAEFITVLMPKPVPAAATAELTLKNAYFWVQQDRGGKSWETKSDLHLGILRNQDRLLPGGVRLSVSEGVKGTCAAELTVEETADGWNLGLKFESRGGRGDKGGKGEYSIELKRKDRQYAGGYQGNYNGRELKGEVNGAVQDLGFPLVVEYSEAPPPAMSAVPNGVKVGEDEILFAGGMDQQPDTAYVTVKRAGKTLLALTGRDLDLDRFQGTIGLFVPDAGYPFGVIPDWLIKQRGKRPDWYFDPWPLTGKKAP